MIPVDWTSVCIVPSITVKVVCFRGISLLSVKDT